MTDPDRAFQDLLEAARADPAILAFWLDGSRGKGRADPFSDYDCTLIVADDALAAIRDRHAGGPLDLDVRTLAQFGALAAWDAPDAWRRYNFAHLTPLVDKTGRVASLMAEKACVPSAMVTAFIDSRLDHLVNQVYRALKCHRTGDIAAAKLEAAEAAAPLLDALFALNGGRLRPYYKYLDWELTTHPLQHALGDPQAFMAMLIEQRDDPAKQVDLLRRAEALFRAHGRGAVFDGWGEALPWMLAYASGSTRAE